MLGPHKTHRQKKGREILILISDVPYELPLHEAQQGRANPVRVARAGLGGRKLVSLTTCRPQ